MAETYRNEASSVIHNIDESLYKRNIIDKNAMRSFDESCLMPIPELSPEDIRAIREREAVYLAVFGRYLNVSKSLVSDWERGARKPVGPTLRLLTIVKAKGLAGILLE